MFVINIVRIRIKGNIVLPDGLSPSCNLNWYRSVVDHTILASTLITTLNFLNIKGRIPRTRATYLFEECSS